MKKQTILAIAVGLLILITSLFYFISVTKKKQEQYIAIKKYQKIAQKIVYDSWNHYKNNINNTGDWWAEKFKHPRMIQDDGRPLAFPDGPDVDDDGLADINWGDPTKPFEYVTASETSSYVLLRAVWMRDKAIFDKVWKWTHDNLQRANVKYVFLWKDKGSKQNRWYTPEELHLERDNLFAWRWIPTVATRNGVNEGGIVRYTWQPPTAGHDPNDPWRDGWDVATDADTDIALALIFADSLWGSRRDNSQLDYAGHARAILNDIWDKATMEAGGMRYLVGGNNIRSIEPGYLSPFSYRIFNDFDSQHDWNLLVDSSYRIFRDAPKFVMNKITDKTGGVHNNDPKTHRPPANLLPDWINVDADGALKDGSPRNEPEFGTDTFRALWRMAVDYMWNKEAAEKYAKDVMFPTSPSSPSRFFRWRMAHPPKELPDKTYDLTDKLSSVFWHNGDVAFFETNYEPPANIPNRAQASNCFRANCANYGVYLAYAYAGGDYELAQKFLYPLITPEADGFSHRQYVIPDDQVKNETPENVKKNTPKNLRDNSHDNAIPFHQGDGWWIKSKWGGYWTQWDHSDWNSQNEYYNNMWAWFGLAAYAGVIQNFYKYQERPPKSIDYIRVYADMALKEEIRDTINVEYVYVLVKGRDANRRHQDFLMLKVSSDDPVRKNVPVSIKLSETAKNSGVFTGRMRIAMESNNALNQIGASRGSKVLLEIEGTQRYHEERQVGPISLSEVVDDFGNGSIDDANPVSWWTDSYFPDSQVDISIGSPKEGYYIWVDQNATWHVAMKAFKGQHAFQGQIYCDSRLDGLTKTGFTSKDSVIINGQSISFSSQLSKQVKVFEFKPAGKFIKFDIKQDGVYDKDHVFIGTSLSTAYSVPFSLNTQGFTGTYTLTPTTANVLPFQKYSLKVEKKYTGKDYPYFGGVIFEKPVMNWTNKDELVFQFYLPSDVGNIRVDIQDTRGTTAILNGYNPWDPQRGPGWYEWRSNMSTGTEVNRDNVDPLNIKDRRFWKGWSFAEGRTVEVTKTLDLKSIVNIQLCVGPGENKDALLYMGPVLLKTSNFYRGTSDPKNVNAINIYKDPAYTKPYLPGSVINQNRIYIELKGKDGNPYTRDTIWVNVDTTDTHPKAKGIKFQLQETDVHTGVYRGELAINIKSNEKLGIVGSSRDSKIKIYSKVTNVSTELTIGDFLLETVIEDFENTLSNQYPASWWTDDLDPLRGEPEYAAGKSLGYFLWQTIDGIWHLRWSSDMKPHRFTGKIVAAKKMEITQRVNFEKVDSATLEKGTTIIFKGQETFGDDGIDFKTTADDIKFDLKVDGIAMGNKVQIGKFEYKKAYSIPFVMKNKGITSTYQLLVTNVKAYDGQNSMFVVKHYNKKDYPYIGKWGLSGEKADLSFQDSLRFAIFLPRDLGNVRVDVEDVSGNSAIINEYNPWDASKGPGWYIWDSNFSGGVGVAEKKIQPLAIKDRIWFKGWDIVKQENKDVTRRINLAKIINLLISVGGGDKKDLNFNIDAIKLYRANYHMGNTLPERIKSINLYSDPGYIKNKINAGEKVNAKTIYIEIVGKDGNPFERDRFDIDLISSDTYKTCKPIKLRVFETAASSGIYHGKFMIDLDSDEAQEVIGAANGKQISVRALDAAITFTVGEMQNSYPIDNFDDGSVTDKAPVTWWIDTVDPVAKKIVLDPVYDKGVYLYKDMDGVWHVDWNPGSPSEELICSFNCEGIFKAVGKRESGSKIDYQQGKTGMTIYSKASDTKLKRFLFKAETKEILFDCLVNGFPAKEKVFIGQEKKTPYVLPMKLSNVPVINNYDLGITDKPVHDGITAMSIKKTFTGNVYPYFGCWGLRGDISNFTDKDNLTFWIYLNDDPGNIRVDIQDAEGITAVLNGYDPYDYAKGPGWYRWTSGYKGGLDIDEGRAQALPIKDRQWWMGWDAAQQKYVDVTDKFNLKKIRNVQFSIGGGDKRSFSVIMDSLSVDKLNDHFGETRPAKVSSVVFYRNADFTDPYIHTDDIKQDKVYFKISGTDGNPQTLDKFKVKIFSDQLQSDSVSVSVFARETGTNTGVYTGMFSLSARSNPRNATLGVEKGRLVYMDFGVGKSAGIKVGALVKQYIIDDFTDGKITDKNPVTWWVDSVDPFAEGSIVSANSKPGYYVWRDKDQWHLRWKSPKDGARFEGKIVPNGRIHAAKFINLDLFDQGKKESRSIFFKSGTRNKISGIDFTADSDYIDFDLRQDGVYDGRAVWIGARNALAYSVPFRLDNNKISSTYKLSVAKSTRKLRGYMMMVDKHYTGKQYPYFGCWGLRGEVSNWLEMDEFYVWMYLPADPGNIKVELEDANGFKGILNGYDPYDRTKGPGWYKWSSNQFNSDEVKSDNIQPLPIKNRQWWKAWSDNDQAFVDTTEQFDPTNVKNVQFILGGGGTRNVVIYMDALVLEKSNFNEGDSYPCAVATINLYKDNKYIVRYGVNEQVVGQLLYIELVGTDSNRSAIDKIEVAVEIKGRLKTGKNITLIESSPDSGVYRGVLNLTAKPEPNRYQVKSGDTLLVRALGCDRKQVHIVFKAFSAPYSFIYVIPGSIFIAILIGLLVLFKKARKNGRHSRL